MIATAIALVACIVYIAISLVVGDFYPFSRYSMYARLTTRDEGAVLYVRAGDAFVAPDDLDAVSGLDVDKMHPNKHGFPTSQEWVVHEAMRWLRTHATDRIEDGVKVEVGYRMLKVDATGQLHERLQVVTTGTGRLRR